jgi:predicted DNA-binding transcriptional regulator AlpA
LPVGENLRLSEAIAEIQRGIRPMAASSELPTITPADRLLNEAEAAAMLGWSRKTLAQRRWRGLPPAHIKIGGSIRYLERDLLAFIAAGRQTPLDSSAA